MDSHQELLQRLAQPSDGKIVLLVLDGVGDLRTTDQPRTALEAATTPHLDALAARSSLGRIVPVATGITPGSGPGHLALFGYDPRRPEVDIGRGVLEALGLGLDVRAGTLAARGNFATADADGRLTDRRAGRLPTAECERLCATIRASLSGADTGGLEVEIHPGEGHRFVLLVRGAELSAALADTDPQRLGVPPLEVTAEVPEAEPTARRLQTVVRALDAPIAAEEKANRVLLRGFSKLPSLPSIGKLYGVRAGAFAGYPLYRGVASACGMEVVPCGKAFADLVGAARDHWDDFDFLFLHVKQTDAAGEDGDLARKAAVLEEVDAGIGGLLELGPQVLAITGDHSTPAPMKAHSWHPVPLLVHGPLAFVDRQERFDEDSCAAGALGTFPARELMGLLLAHCGRLAKFGA